MIYTIRQWVNENIESDDSQWLIVVLKVTGRFLDTNGVSRQIVNELSYPKLLRAVDWTISTVRRKLHTDDMRFIPFIGGDSKKGVSTHVHAFIEIPSGKSVYRLIELLTKFWDQFCKRLFKTELKSKVWYEPLQKHMAKNHTYYCTRYEGKTFMSGDEKVLVECDSCCLY